MSVSLTLSEGRARMIASECPLTWRQVVLLAYQSHEETQLWDHAHWLQWGPIRGVGEWLWEYWVDHAGEEVERRAPVEFPVRPAPAALPSVGRPAGLASPSRTTARAAGKRPWRAWCSAAGYLPSPVPASPGMCTSASGVRWPESCPIETLTPGGCDDAD